MTETITSEEIELKEQVVKENILVLFDDNVNTFDHVIDLLVRYVTMMRYKQSNALRWFIVQENVPLKKGNIKSCQLWGKS